MAQLHSLLVLQQFMRSLGEDMEEAELVRYTKQGESQKSALSDEKMNGEILLIDEIFNILLFKLANICTSGCLHFLMTSGCHTRMVIPKRKFILPK